ncbi:MAG: PadR family transcriptional regulator [Anaerolineales bacterium]|nr:PadR family transcriptional regulator [Anaerolineales bacterium]
MATRPTSSSAADNLDLELRRGVVVLAVLSQLQTEQYGYSLKKALADRGLEIDEGTLYPLLRRLESQGLLQSAWRMAEARPRRYYVISPGGRRVYEALSANWRALTRVIDQMVHPVEVTDGTPGSA